MRVLALSSYPARMASTRFRICEYIPHLARMGITVTHLSWLSDQTAAVLYEPNSRLRTVAGGLYGGIRLLAHLLRSKFDVVWVLREAMLLGPPVAEMVAASRAPLVYDFDDALWIGHADRGGGLKFSDKFDWLIHRATMCVAGSRHLAKYSSGLGVRSVVLPTVVPAQKWTPRAALDDSQLRVGWIGTHSTAPQLALCASALGRLRSEVDFELIVIGAGADLDLDVDATCRSWQLHSEVDDFRSLSIGLCPMFQSPWHEGKCGFKQLQFMAVGVPFVSSFVGGARDFVRNEENALTATTPDEWYVQLQRLMSNRELRTRLARAGRRLVESRYSTEVQVKALAEALRSARHA